MYTFIKLSMDDAFTARVQETTETVVRPFGCFLIYWIQIQSHLYFEHSQIQYDVK